MSMTMSGTTLTFNDSTTQTTAPFATGQSWGDYTTTRAVNTTYTNSTSKPIGVYYGLGASSGEPVIGGVTLPLFDCANGNTRTCGFFVVPAGSTYRVNCGGPNITKWAELR